MVTDDQNYDLVKLTDEDRKMLKQASKLLEETDPYLAGRLAGLSGRVPE